jgi:radical SAM protein with 4Fe4S-binding SPASM domain
MTNEEAKVFLNNLKICIDEHPIVADWLVEIANRKTENSSEKPNNCEPQTYVINPQEPTNDDKCFDCDDFFTCGGQCNKIEDEPKTERSSEWTRKE